MSCYEKIVRREVSVMKIAFPTDETGGLDSLVYGHFGTAPAFVIAETDDHSTRTVVNGDLSHRHGNCQPLKALGGFSVDAIVVGEIGSGALSKLQTAGIRVYRAIEGSIKDNLELIIAGKLPEFSQDHICRGHHQDRHCAH
jgi:predicted Fe-Mo cluster-binding NifX family protein